MKKFLLFIFLIPFIGSAQKKTASKPKGFVVTGNIKGLPDSRIKLTSTQDTIAISTAYSVDGKFTLKGTVKEPGLYYFTAGPLQPLHIYLENSKISIIGSKDDMKNVKITGSKSHDDFVVFQNTFNPMVGDLNGTAAKMQMPGAQPNNDSLYNRYEAIRRDIQANIDAYIKKRPKSYVSPWLIFITSQLSDDIALMENRYNMLDKSIKQSEIGKGLAEFIAYNKVGAIGTEAIDFVQPDTTGSNVSLSSFRGKYVLVDFWASWCGPCRIENPNVVANYNKFKSKNFTVLGVSLDRPGRKVDWMNAIYKDGLYWTHVSDLKGWQNEAAIMYRVQSIPFNFLVDPNGRIVAKNLRGPQLESKLCELLGCN